MAGEDNDAYHAMRIFLRGKFETNNATLALRLLDALMEDEEREEFVRLLQKWMACK